MMRQEDITYLKRCEAGILKSPTAMYLQTCAGVVLASGALIGVSHSVVPEEYKGFYLNGAIASGTETPRYQLITPEGSIRWLYNEMMKSWADGRFFGYLYGCRTDEKDDMGDMNRQEALRAMEELGIEIVSDLSGIKSYMEIVVKPNERHLSITLRNSFEHDPYFSSGKSFKVNIL